MPWLISFKWAASQCILGSARIGVPHINGFINVEIKYENCSCLNPKKYRIDSYIAGKRFAVIPSFYCSSLTFRLHRKT